MAITKATALAQLEKMKLAIAEGGQITVNELASDTGDYFYFDIYIHYLDKDSHKVKTFDFTEAYAVLNDLYWNLRGLTSEHIIPSEDTSNGYDQLEKNLQDLFNAPELEVNYMTPQWFQP